MDPLNSPVVSVEDVFHVEDAFKSRMLLMDEDEKEIVAECIEILISDIVTYAIANAQGWLSELLIDRPATLELGNLITGRYVGDLYAGFEGFLIRFSVERRTGLVTLISFERRCQG